jgi:hypothetical protein
MEVCVVPGHDFVRKFAYGRKTLPQEGGVPVLGAGAANARAGERREYPTE